MRFHLSIIRPLLCLGLSWLALTPGPVRAQFLFDATKAEMAGNADWVIDADAHNLSVSSASDGSGKLGGSESNPQRTPTAAASGITSTTAETYWTGALSSWGVSLVQHGQSVETLPYNGAITFGNASNAQDLSHYKVFVLAEPNIVFTAAEKVAILSFVQSGGGLFMISDHGTSDRNNDGKDSVGVWNDLMTNNTVKANPFGISFNGDNVSPTGSVTSSGSDPIIHGSIGGVTSFIYSNGSTMTLNTAQNSTVTGAVWSSSTHTNSTVTVAYGTFGAGRFVAAGDSSPFDDGTGDPKDTLYKGWTDGTASGDDGRLAMNASIWLSASAIVPVPEPGAAVLLAAGALPLLLRRKRRR